MITSESLIHDLEILTYKEVLSIKDKDEETAISCANALFNCLYINFKTRLMYVPSHSKTDINKEYEDIYSDYSNNYSYQDLAVKYHRSVQNIYTITKAIRSQHVRKYQSDLFPLTEETEQKKPITLIVIEEYLPAELVHCGLSIKESNVLSKKISKHLIANFPGVSITISNAMKKNRSDNNQTSLF